MKKFAVVLFALGALSTTAFASNRDVTGPLGSADVPSFATANSASVKASVAMNGDAHQPLSRYERDSKLPNSAAG